jgi:hypothetical protein
MSGEQNKLGLGYQLGFVRLFNQFPAQVTFEPIEDLVAYMSLQLDIAPVLIGPVPTLLSPAAM